MIQNSLKSRGFPLKSGIRPWTKGALPPATI